MPFSGFRAHLHGGRDGVTNGVEKLRELCLHLRGAHLLMHPIEPLGAAAPRGAQLVLDLCLNLANLTLGQLRDPRGVNPPPVYLGQRSSCQICSVAGMIL